ncbi:MULTISPECIES: LCP family protein [Bacillus]|uniref:LCP family protein n=1 Tax=Bacillus TaxID=1386 RepID=UPI0003A79C10|nr:MULTISPECIES: LCP family protein [Bacillus amyloliquefaciens group]ASS63151.1 Putative transcriptional regulator YvhJ [Bacillus velezensis]ATC50881.1 Putative transcriptional regulator YvhJ [Bacillus velezensis]MBA5710876.1 LytR family transcriptional regulator [Bacillus velezensis]MCW5195038.1 putative transcriptional regulator YvhJ [Bacillus amyloliquefaciens]MEC3848827.1 LCP family protein [Bacillus velezensis]
MAERVRVRVRKKKKSKRKIIFKRILLLLTLVLLVAAGFGGYKVYKTINAADNAYDALSRGDKSKLRDKVINMKKKPFSILFMGIENYATSGKGGRSDSLIVVTLDPRNKTMKMLSIPRDTRVTLAGDTTGNKTKINAAFAKGGADETVSTVEDLLGIPIDKYVTVDFNGFKDVIDEVGGVDVKVPFDFDEMSDVSKKKRIYFKKGNMHLNGEQALAYARMRKQDKRGDFGRNDRQKQILNALIDQMSRAGNIAKIDKIAETASNNVQTNIRITEGLALQQIYSGFTSKKIDTLTITGSDLYLGGTATTRGTYYFQPDPANLEKVRQELQKHLDYPSGSSTASDPASDSTGTDSTTDSTSGSTGTSGTTDSTNGTAGANGTDSTQSGGTTGY